MKIHDTTTRRAAGWALLAGAVLTLTPLLRSSEDESPVESTRVALEKMVDARRIISQERRDWQLGREILVDRIELVQDEIASLREKIAADEENIAEADAKRLELTATNESLQEATGDLETVITELEARTKKLLARLPESLQETVRPFSQGFPEDPADTDVSLSRRFQNVIAVLEGVDKFHREIRVTTEVRDLADGGTAEVTALYVGLGHGYYVTAAGDAAGVGTGTEEGWTWRPANDAAPAIQEAIDILESKVMASFVSLPVEIQ